MSTSTWCFVELDAAVAAHAGLPAARWPVPADQVAECLRPPVSLDRILEFADERGDPALGPAVARLAYLVAVDELDDHLFEHAEHHLRIGLAHAPGNVSLRSHLGLALWGLRRYDEALEALLAAVASCRAARKIAPVLWLLTARALDDRSRTSEALVLLDELAALVPDDDAFWDLLAVLRERAVQA